MQFKTYWDDNFVNSDVKQWDQINLEVKWKLYLLLCEVYLPKNYIPFKVWQIILNQRKKRAISKENHRKFCKSESMLNKCRCSNNSVNVIAKLPRNYIAFIIFLTKIKKSR